MKGVIYLRTTRRNNQMIKNIDILNKYFEETYGAKVVHIDDKNQIFDAVIHNQSQNLTVELKQRFLNTYYYNQDDILIEFIQATEPFKYPSTTSPKRLNLSIGWFYKTTGDRLVYFKHCEELNKSKIIDLDWKQFFPFLLDNLNKFSTSDWIYSGKTTGALNLSIKEDWIPKRMCMIKEIDGGLSVHN
jgi:hypothetical protein